MIFFLQQNHLSRAIFLVCLEKSRLSLWQRPSSSILSTVIQDLFVFGSSGPKDDVAMNWERSCNLVEKIIGTLLIPDDVGLLYFLL